MSIRGKVWGDLTSVSWHDETGGILGIALRAPELHRHHHLHSNKDPPHTQWALLGLKHTWTKLQIKKKAVQSVHVNLRKICNYSLHWKIKRQEKLNCVFLLMSENIWFVIIQSCLVLFYLSQAILFNFIVFTFISFIPFLMSKDLAYLFLYKL